MNLRCSIIGFEKKTNYSLLNWYWKNKNKKINGYKNYIWNGITTDALSKICMGIINKDLFLVIYTYFLYVMIVKNEFYR